MYDSEKFEMMEAIIELANNVPGIPPAVKDKILERMKSRNAI